MRNIRLFNVALLLVAVLFVQDSRAQTTLEGHTERVESMKTSALTSEAANSDSVALVALYNATNGPSWRNKTNWLSNQPLDEWAGVSTENVGQVYELRLERNLLSGEIPSELGNLANLRYLVLNQNRLSGEIPSELGNLASLRYLELDQNRFSGEIPAELGNLTNLERLVLSDNQLTGTIPKELGNLTNLTHLELDDNQLSTLPDSLFAGLSSLAVLSLDGNSVDPLPLTISLEQVGTDQVKAVAPTGAPFDIVLPISVTNGSLSGGATTITIPAGSVESALLTVVRTPGTTAAVTVDIGTLPGLPTDHAGYALVKASDLPLEVSSTLANTAPVFTDGASTTRTITENTAAGVNIGTAIAATDADHDVLTYTLRGTDAAAFNIESTTGQLRTKAALDYETKSAYSVVITVSDGSLTDTITVTINVTDLEEVGESIVQQPEQSESEEQPEQSESEEQPEQSESEEQPEQSESEEQPEQSPPYARDPAFDFDTLQDAGNTSPVGIWSDGTTMWVADGWFNATSGRTKIYAYDMATKERVPIKEFNTLYDAGNTSPTGIWSDGTTMWVADDGDGDPDKIYAYDMATKERVPTKEFNTLYDAKNYHPRGIWSDGTTMWVADDGNRDDPDKIYAYDMATKERVPTKEFNTLAPGNTYPYGIWSDGTTMWVTNWYDEDGNPDKIYAYNMTTKERIRTREFNTWHDRIYNPTGIWSDGTTMWVADETDGWGTDKIYAYNMPANGDTPDARDLDKDFNTLDAAGNDSPHGLWSDGTTLWVTDWLDGKLYAYNLSTKARDPDKDFNTLIAAGNDSPQGLWSDGTTLWVTDSSDGKLYAYNLSTKARDPDKDFNTLIAAGNDSPQGLWSDGTTLWVTDWLDDKLYAYNLSTKARDPDKDFNTLDAAGNDSPHGLWSDGTTLWVTDWLDDKLYAYNLSTKARDPDKDFNTLGDAWNNWPHGLWSDGTTLWVTDSSDSKLYAYHMPANGDTPDASAPLANTTPVFTDGASTTRTIAENTTAGVNIGTAIAATDADHDALTYTLRGTDAAAFNIESTTGQLQTKAALDYETKSVYMVTVTVSDGTLTDTIIVTINVTDLEEVGESIVQQPEQSPPYARDRAKEFDTLQAAGNERPHGIWSDGTTMWVADWSDSKIYAYNLATKAPDPNNDFNTLEDAGNDSPRGLWSDGTTMWVADWSDSKIYAYDLATKAPDPNNDFNTLRAAGNDDPVGLWSDGTTLWVGNSQVYNAKLYAYNLATKAPDPNNDFNTLEDAGNRWPTDLWSDGTTLWVADWRNAKLYAYNLATKARDPNNDFNTLRAAGNVYPRGLWSDGTTLWVADAADAKIYAYRMPSQPAAKAQALIGLPDEPQLQQNAPNPFNSQTVLSYFLPESGAVRLELFSVTGQRVAVLRQGPQQAGYHHLRWNAQDGEGRPLASGIYFYRLETADGILTRKLTLLR